MNQTIARSAWPVVFVLLFCASVCPTARAAGAAIDDAPPLPAGPDSSTGANDVSDAPPLPAGPGDTSETPPLPAGPGDSADGAAPPPLPEGPGASALDPDLSGLGAGNGPGVEKPKDVRPALLQWLDVHGFLEGRLGFRTQPDPDEKTPSIAETRLQLDWQKTWRQLTFKLVADFLYDPILDRHLPRLNEGTGAVDLRQANVSFSPLPWMDVKVGRQILTWGTGDLLFLNDLFPKDWQSFFIGRDVEYLKAPSDAIKISAFSEIANVDVVYTPQFDPDRYIRGRRLSYYSPMAGSIVGRNAVVEVDRPDDWFRDHEWAVRLSKTIESTELAAYFYNGYWKSPGGTDPMTGHGTFPRLRVWGASVRGKVARGIGNLEAAYYDSRQDAAGLDPFVNNSQWRFLAGYKQELAEWSKDLTVGVQYYVEWMQDYDKYRRTLPAGMAAADEVRHLLTIRITKLLLNQNLTLSLFAFYSPTDSDAYLRPRIEYQVDDHWSVALGGNVFFGGTPRTFFSQFQRNSNVYVAIRYGF